MITLNLKAAQAGFFDRKAVMDAVGKARKKVLSKFGAYVRTRARSSLKAPGKKARKAKAVSAPGRPPFSQTGTLKKFLFFSYDFTRESVVIGPARINGVVDPRALPALEYGGPSTVEDRRGGTRRPVSVKARPFMGPALAKELPGLPAMWRDSVK